MGAVYPLVQAVTCLVLYSLSRVFCTIPVHCSRLRACVATSHPSVHLYTTLVVSQLAERVYALVGLLSSSNIYPEDIVGSIPSLKHLSMLVVLQSLLNTQAELDYLRTHTPA
jgi:hypothetical protein